MDDILPRLLVFPPHPPPKISISDAQYDEGIKNQITAVAKIPERHLLQPTSGGESTLDVSLQFLLEQSTSTNCFTKVINPALNTIPYLFILNAHCSGIVKSSHQATDIDTLCDKIDYFLESFDGRQARYVGKELGQLLDYLAEIARRCQQVCL